MVIINIYNVKWKRRYTRKELSELTGISPAALTKLTKGEHVDVKISTLENLRNSSTAASLTLSKKFLINGLKICKSAL